MHLRNYLIGGIGLGLLGACWPLDEPPAGEDLPPVSVDAAPAVIKRLTRSQYNNAIYDLVGPEIAVPISLEPDHELDGFLVVGGSTSAISVLGVERYETAAYSIAKQAMESSAVRERLLSCTPAANKDDACAGDFVQSFGRRAFRRPLSSDEVARYVAVAGEAADTLGGFYDGIAFVLAGLLQSPNFLFRIELGEPAADGQRLRYSDYEMATRMSFFLWNSTPDDELLDAAAAGALTTVGGLTVQLDRMLASPRAREGVRNFFYERLQLNQLDDLVKDGDVFPAMSAELGPYAREETLMMVEDLVFERDADYRELFTSQRTFINPKLASLYGVPAPSLDGFAAYEFPADHPRAGLLGQASVLAMHAHSTASSATLRGVFVRMVLLCGESPPPPADVNTTLPEPSPELPTLRDRIKVHVENPVCASCHGFLDPIGLGLEQFDGIGKYRETESGGLIDPSGSLDGRDFADGRGLGVAIAEHPDVARCLTRQLYRYATAKPETEGEEALIEWLTQVFSYDAFRVQALLRRIVLSDGFRFAQEAE